VTNLFEAIRSLGFGALLGSGVLGLFYSRFPELFPAVSDLHVMLWLGALIGGGLHHMIHKWLICSFFGPIGRSLAYYGKLAQLALLRKQLGKKIQTDLIKELTKSYIQGNYKCGEL
jgi:hypothetical protein